MTEGDENDPAERSQNAEWTRQQLIAALEQYRHGSYSRPEPEHLVHLLFWFLLQRRDQLSPGVCYDEDAVRHWFVEQGRSKEPREQSEIANWALLQRYDLAKEVLGDEFKPMQFVHDEVEANKKFPRSKQRGARGTNSSAFYVHLQTRLNERETERKRAAELARQRELWFWRDAIDYGRRRLAEVSAAFVRASSKINKSSGSTPT